MLREKVEGSASAFISMVHRIISILPGDTISEDGSDSFISATILFCWRDMHSFSRYSALFSSVNLAYHPWPLDRGLVEFLETVAAFFVVEPYAASLGTRPFSHQTDRQPDIPTLTFIITRDICSCTRRCIREIFKWRMPHGL
jgi:hypothetical protein